MEDAVEDEREWTLNDSGPGKPFVQDGPALNLVTVVVPKDALLAAQQRAEEAELGDEMAKAEQAYAENRAERAESKRDYYKTKYERLNNGQEE